MFNMVNAGSGGVVLGRGLFTWNGKVSEKTILKEG